MKKRILVIDDEPTFTELVRFNLEETGKYTVKIEHKGALALESAKEFKPNLILLDIMIPDLGGEKVAHQLKNCENTKNIPVILLTAVISKEEARLRDNVFGQYLVIAKPISIEKLLKVVADSI